MKNLATDKTPRNTAYHPQSNGLIEQQYRTIKASLRCHLQQNKSWVDALPFLLLGLRMAVKEGIGYSSAELLYRSIPYITWRVCYQDP
ncbi:hypothetical protein NPIL_239311 [Nephila pilipes]|uniref:Integrase catalytic domain-containing protein n=1 Tax=Nephila pilipes TaxID=299642 RepID=A0A8X6QFG7_NEPPI|nr:hypothetical protein NPIL_239311 [Nephila pilipes]